MREKLSNPSPKGNRKVQIPKGIPPPEMLDISHKVKWPTENKT